MSSFYGAFKFVSVVEVYYTLLRVHLVVYEAAKVLRTVFENHFTETLEGIFAYFPNVQYDSRVLIIKPIFTTTLHLILLKTTGKLITSLVNGTAPTMPSIRLPLTEIRIV
jgi:hypothetical protein